MSKQRTGLAGLAALRRQAGYTQSTLAAALGVQRGRLSMWESSGVWPSAAILPELARLLGCTIEELYREPDAENIVTRTED